MRGDRTMQDGRARSSEELWAGLVAEVAVMPDVVANLLREHQPDDQGFCTGNGCGTAGRGVPTVQWPCALHTLATEAKGAGASQRAPASEERTGAQATEDERPISTAAAWLLRRR